MPARGASCAPLGGLVDSLEAFRTEEAPVALKGPSTDSIKQGQGLSGQALQPLAPMFPLSPQSAQRPHHSRLAVDEAMKQLYFVPEEGRG